MLRTLSMTDTLNKAQILEWLQAVKDPEIPTISLIDLGVVRGVEIDEASGARFRCISRPPSRGCPAMDYMKRDVERTLLRPRRGRAVEVEISLREAWTSDMITDAGRAALRQHKLSPPPVLGNTWCSTSTFWSTPSAPTATATIRSCARRLELRCAGPCTIATTAASCSSSSSRCSFAGHGGVANFAEILCRLPPMRPNISSLATESIQAVQAALQAQVDAWNARRFGARHDVLLELAPPDFGVNKTWPLTGAIEPVLAKAQLDRILRDPAWT